MGASSLQPLKRIDFDGRGRVSQEHVKIFAHLLLAPPFLHTSIREFELQ